MGIVMVWLNLKEVNLIVWNVPKRLCVHVSSFSPCTAASRSPGAAPWNISVLFRPAGWHWLRGYAGCGLSAAHPSAGSGSCCILPTGPTPPTGHVFYSLQPCRLQEPSRHTPPGQWQRLLWPAGQFREGRQRQCVGLEKDRWIVYGYNMYPLRQTVQSDLLKQIFIALLCKKSVIFSHL